MIPMEASAFISVQQSADFAFVHTYKAPWGMFTRYP